MSKLVATGKTVEDAVNQGLTRWNVGREQVSVQIVSQPSKGFLGLFSREAKVELTLLSDSTGGDSLDQGKAHISGASPLTASELQEGARKTVLEKPETSQLTGILSDDDRESGPDPYEEAVRFLKDTAQAMGLDIGVDVDHGKDHTTLQLSGEGLGMIIGRRGQTLDALQYLTNIVANRYGSSYVRIILDAENFRERRKKTLEGLADRLAKQAVNTRKEIVLEPMPSSERKIIHARLQHHSAVKTVSKGDEPHRRVVIMYKRP
ncbi:RNA-binding cell elongation regulator Jag/EloR [Paenibacillus lemnae]|uniref:RNA-binding protein KhpB n=1 Tax=Paenibacillus lemnae TaxID=1330551 RepID=A0A848M3B1_PAELE|nr:RNA-binding cell elongation regulator Jag/EloR [Paenibacillus lemnae]NMO94184.1 protein jag [Paenibacillus lemnae]